MLGKLMRVDNLRATWPDEARDFTPWLARAGNLEILSETLGLGPDGLELEAVEKFVGPYKADILCRETGLGDWVLIENQLERTDHSHLGQLIVYAAGLGAKTVVWISRQVSPEHKAAMEWLNEIGNGGPSFFALEIELWRIGDSPLAPRFNVVVSPNDWTRSATSARKGIEEGELSVPRQMLVDYWTGLEAEIARRRGPVRPVRPLPQNWIVHGLGKTGVTLNASVNRRENWIRAEIYLTGKTARDYFDWLKGERAAIEAETGPLVWYDGAANDRRIYLEQACPDVGARDGWEAQHRWLAERLEILHRAFHDRVRRLDPDTAAIV